MSLGRDGRGEEALYYVHSGGCSVTHVPSGELEERRISGMYAVGDTQRHMSLVGDGGGEEVLSYVHSEGGSVTHVTKWGWGGEEDLYPVHSVSGEQWQMGKRKGFVPCM